MGIGDFRLSGAADTPDADLHNRAEPVHLGSPPNRAGVAFGDTIDFVAPVQVGVHVHQRNGFVAFESPHNWDGYPVVTT